MYGWFRALDLIRKDRNHAAFLMGQREHLSADDFQKALQGLRFPDIEESRLMLAEPAPSLIPAARQLGQVMLANRLIERTPELKELFDGNFVKDARP